MAMATEAAYDEIQWLDNVAYLAEFRYGGNGYLTAAPEYDVGNANGDVVYGRTMWDGEILDGIDSDWHEVDLYVDSNGIRWSVDGNVLSYTSVLFNSFQQIGIRAAVDEQAALYWSRLEVTFYDDGEETDVLVLDTGPVADRMNDTDPGAEDVILNVVSSHSTNDAIRLTALVKIACPEGVFLGENSAFGQVLIG